MDIKKKKIIFSCWDSKRYLYFAENSVKLLAFLVTTGALVWGFFVCVLSIFCLSLQSFSNLIQAERVITIHNSVDTIQINLNSQLILKWYTGKYHAGQKIQHFTTEKIKLSLNYKWTLFLILFYLLLCSCTWM